MFYEGTLQEGIASAVQGAKLVICFVTNDGSESKLWEEEFLRDSSIAGTISTHAVLLRLQAGSEEAKYLAAIFPLPKTPTLVLIRNGELKEYIAAGVTKTDFLARVQKALGLALPVVASTPSHQAEQVQPAQQTQPPVGHRSASAAVPTAAVDMSSNSSSAQDTPASSSHEDQPLPHPQQQQASSSSRKEEDERRRHRAEKGKWKADREPDSDADADADATSVGLPKKQVQKATETYKKRQLEAQEQRRRILEQIEFDRQARKAREQERRAERLAAQQQEEGREGGEEAVAMSSIPPGQTAAAASATTTSSSKRKGPSETCALQVRDFDGSTMRTRIPSSSTLRSEVRRWVDENRSPENGAAPYTFKVVLTPLPNKTVEETEEDGTLLDLGLAPSATLILVPVGRGGGYAAAYAAAGPDAGFLARVWAFILGFWASVVLFFKTIFTGAPVPAAQGQEHGGQQRQQQQGRHESARVTGFRNPNDERREQQLYNGNSLNFEPRPDDEDEVVGN